MCACGESGCCHPTKCKMSPNGKYCGIYLALLRSAYITLESLLEKQKDFQQNKALDEWIKNDSEQLGNVQVDRLS
jgi:hypothetical protein